MVRIFCIVCPIIVISFINSVDAKLITVKQCIVAVEKIEKKYDFIRFARELFSHDDEALDEEKIPMLNKCLNSFNGLQDMRALMKIMEREKSTSVCAPDFDDGLVAFKEQLIKNAARCRALYTIEKHRLWHFFQKYVDQVVSMCEDVWKPDLFRYYSDALRV